MDESDKTHTKVPRWWVPRPDDGDPDAALAERIIATVTTLWDDLESKRNLWDKRAKLYYGDRRHNVTKGGQRTKQTRDDDDLRFNVTRNAVDSLQARIAKQRPLPSPVTSGGTYDMQKRAKHLGAFLRGVFYQNKSHAMLADAFRDGEIFEDGFMKVYGEVRGKAGAIVHERLLPWQILVDPIDAYDGKPRSFFERRLVDRSALEEMFCDNAGEDVSDAEKARRRKVIKKTSVATFEEEGRDTLTEQVIVVEAYRTASYPGAEDGIHAIVTDKGLLYRRVYKRTRAPYVKIPWKRPLVGWRGLSLVEEMAPIQQEINETATSIQRILYHGGGPKIIFEAESFEEDHWNNSLKMAMIKLKPGATPPTLWSPNVVSPEYFRHLESLIQRAFQDVGASEMTATSQKPAGLDSGKALRVFSDIESERFVIPGQNYEAAVVLLGELSIEAAQELHEAKVPLEVPAPTKRRRRHFLQKIRWKDIKLDRDAYVLQIFPENSLTHAPAGRTATVEQLIGAGFISRHQGLYLLDQPDLESIMDLELAPWEIALDLVERVLDEGKPVVAFNFLDFEVTMTVAQQALLRAMIDEVPLERQQMLIDFISDIHAEIQKTQDEAQQEAMAAAAAADPAAQVAAGGAPPDQTTPLPAPPSIDNAGPAGAAAPIGSAQPV